MDLTDMDPFKHRFRRYRNRLLREVLKMSASVLVGAKFMQLLFPAVMEGTSGPCTDRLFVAVLILIFALYVMPPFKWAIKWMMSGADWASDDEMRALRGDVQENAGAAVKEALYQVFAGKGFWGKRKEMFRTGMLTGWDIVLYLVFTAALDGLMLAILPGEAAVMAVWSLPVVAYLVVMTQREDYIIARFLIMRGEGKKNIEIKETRFLVR